MQRNLKIIKEISADYQKKVKHMSQSLDLAIQFLNF